jgi:hypothetical protein
MLFKKKIFFCFFIFLVHSKILAQLDVLFITHLSNTKLQNEHENYLKLNHDESDTSFYHQAKFFLQYKKDSLFFDCFKKADNLFFLDTIAVNFACNYFISSNEKNRVFWFDSLLKVKENRYNCPIERLYLKAKEPREQDVTDIPEMLKEDFTKYVNANRKKPFLAGLFSAIVPGLGKLYIGNIRSFSMTLISNSLFALQSIESYKSKGINHPFTVFNMTFFSGFYAVNIYGSYSETQKKKLDLKNQFLIHVANYYSDYSSRLY